jgi:hypothetical protein
MVEDGLDLLKFLSSLPPFSLFLLAFGQQDKKKPAFPLSSIYCVSFVIHDKQVS